MSYSHFTVINELYFTRSLAICWHFPICVLGFYLIFLLFRFGTFGVDHALNAGVDLEVPGLNKWRTVEYVNRSIQARKVTATTVKQWAKNRDVLYRNVPKALLK
jgi:hypothetical protein